MNKFIENSIKKLEYKIRILENLDKIVEEFNLIPGHIATFDKGFSFQKTEHKITYTNYKDFVKGKCDYLGLKQEEFIVNL